MEEFFPVPSFSDYEVSRSGTIRNIHTGKELVGSTNPAGYHNVRMKRDDGYVATLGRYRVLALTFIPYVGDLKILQVNHIDGDKSNDAIENLEWVSPKENCEHAGRIGISSKCKPISIRNVKTGMVRKFPSMIETAKFLGVTKDTVIHRSKFGDAKVWPDGYQYRRSWSDNPWPDPVDIEIIDEKSSRARAVLLKEHKVGTVTRFSTMSQMAGFLGWKLSTISMWMKRDGQPVLPGLVQVKFADDPTPWREVKDPYIELSETSQVEPIVIVDSVTNKHDIFESGTECCRELGIMPTLLNHRLNKNKEKPAPDGKIYRYYKDFVKKHPFSPTEQ